ncbi:hypothetical protein IQ06DRAFT_305401 [Phaeosphaeriaceae sp. SRC1lsM3a]|nr:hypothetical protein IQ06DRAFT_305401 [Stagonospora sp. SRC1lsM3a]
MLRNKSSTLPSAFLPWSWFIQTHIAERKRSSFVCNNPTSFARGMPGHSTSADQTVEIHEPTQSCSRITRSKPFRSPSESILLSSPNSSFENRIMKMSGMSTLVFTTVVATAASAMRYDGPGRQYVDSRDECAPLPALCTGPVMLQGSEMTLTYVCPKTSEVPSTVHVTVTATTTVTIPGDIPAESTAPVEPSHPAHPGPFSEEPTTTTTTTIHTTSTNYKTVTLTHKKSTSVPDISSAVTSANTATLTVTEDPTWLITATSLFEIPTPNPPSSTANSSFSSSSVSSQSFGFTLLPIPTNSRPFSTSSVWVPSVRPPVITIISSSGFSIPSSENATSSSKSRHSHSHSAVFSWPTGHSSDLYTKHENPTPTYPTYHFPTLRQIREVNATASMSASAKPSDKTGGAGQMDVSVAALLVAVMAAVYFV